MIEDSEQLEIHGGGKCGHSGRCPRSMESWRDRPYLAADAQCDEGIVDFDG